MSPDHCKQAAVPRASWKPPVEVPGSLSLALGCHLPAHPGSSPETGSLRLLEHSLWLSPGPSGCPFSGPFAGSSSSPRALSVGPVWGSLPPRICYSSLSPRDSSSQATTNTQLCAGKPRRHILGLETRACTCTIESPANFSERLTVLSVFTTSPCLHSSPHFLNRIIIYLLLKTPAK